MRVMLATDGSASADRARDLTAGLPWPDGTTIRVVTIAEEPGVIAIPPVLVPTAEGIDEFVAGMREMAETTLDEAEGKLRRPGLTIERRLLRGRPAYAIVDEAIDWEPDLIVLGSRGHSRIASLVIGSTSAEVVDHAPCPVLVARDSEVASIVLADDGSLGAMLAESVLTAWPVFRNLPISIVTVGEPGVPAAATMAPGLDGGSLSGHVRAVEEARDELLAVAESAADRLGAAGIEAVAHVREGSAAKEILDFALGRPHPVLILGSRGHGRLARLVLGSVARNVLYHAAGSVLIVREDVTIRPHAEVRKAVAAG